MDSDAVQAYSINYCIADNLPYSLKYVYTMLIASTYIVLFTPIHLHKHLISGFCCSSVSTYFYDTP